MVEVAATVRRQKRKEIVLLIVILLVGITLRSVYTGLPRMVRWDEAAYQLIARSLLTGLGYQELFGAPDIQQPPMVAYLSALGQSLGLPLAWATAGIVHVLIGGLLPLPVYGLARRLPGGGRRVALIAALLVAIHPALAVSPLYWSTMTEPSYTFFVLCGLFAAWRTVETGQRRWAAGMGVAFGLAYLTRPEALAYLALMTMFVVACRLWAARHRIRSALVPTLTLAAIGTVVFLLLASPYVIYLYRVTGRWAFSGKQGISMEIAWAYLNHSQAMHDRAVASLDSTGKEIMWLSPEQFDRTLMGWIQQDPLRFVKQVRTNVVALGHALLYEDLFDALTLGLIVLGLFAKSWTRARARGEILLLLALVPMLSTVPFWVLSRFLAVAIPIGLIWAAIGLDHLTGWAGETLRNLSASRGGSIPLRQGSLATRLKALPLALTIAGPPMGWRLGGPEGASPPTVLAHRDGTVAGREHSGRGTGHVARFRVGALCRSARGSIPERGMAAGGSICPGPRSALPRRRGRDGQRPAAAVGATIGRRSSFAGPDYAGPTARPELVQHPDLRAPSWAVTPRRPGDAGT